MLLSLQLIILKALVYKIFLKTFYRKRKEIINFFFTAFNIFDENCIEFFLK